MAPWDLDDDIEVREEEDWSCDCDDFLDSLDNLREVEENRAIDALVGRYGAHLDFLNEVE